MDCSECGKALRVGEWPFCPHGEPGAFTEIGDECDFVVENLGREPIRFRSKAEHRRVMAERGLRHPERYVPHPAGKTSREHAGTPNMGCADAYTMNNVRELMERAFRQKPEPDDSVTFIPDNHDLTKDDVKYLKREGVL